MPPRPVLGDGCGRAAVRRRNPVARGSASILRRRSASGALRCAHSGRPRATRGGAKGPQANWRIVSRRVVRAAMHGCARSSIFLSCSGTSADPARHLGNVETAGEMAHRAESSKRPEKAGAKRCRLQPERTAGGGCPRSGGRFRKIGLRACKLRPGGLAFPKALLEAPARRLRGRKRRYSEGNSPAREFWRGHGWNRRFAARGGSAHEARIRRRCRGRTARGVASAGALARHVGAGGRRPPIPAKLRSADHARGNMRGGVGFVHERRPAQ